MSSGKAIAQAGHAYTDALISSLYTDRGRAYAALRPGTKICLDGGSHENLMRLAGRLDAVGLSFSLITDHGHVELPHFDGGDVVTAIGIGPLYKTESPSFLKKFKLWTGPHQPVARYAMGKIITL